MAIRKVIQVLPEHKLNHQSVIVVMIVLVPKTTNHDSSFIVNCSFLKFHSEIAESCSSCACDSYLVPKKITHYVEGHLNRIGVVPILEHIR